MDSFGFKRKPAGFRYFHENADHRKKKKDRNSPGNEKTSFRFFDFSEILKEKSSLSMNQTFQFKSFQNLRKIQLKSTKIKPRVQKSEKIVERNKSQENSKKSSDNYKQIVENARARLRIETPSLPKLTSTEEKPVNILISTPKCEKYVKFKKNKLLDPEAFKKSWRFSKVSRTKDENQSFETEKSFGSSPHTIQANSSPKKLL